MAYDEELAARVRDVLGGESGVTEKRMFGGLAFLVDGHLAVSASSRGGLLVRVDPAAEEALLEEAGARPSGIAALPRAGGDPVRPPPAPATKPPSPWGAPAPALPGRRAP